MASARGQPRLRGGGRQAHGTRHGRFGTRHLARRAEGRKQASELHIDGGQIAGH